MTRKMSVAGTFYPARAVELDRYFEHFTLAYDEEFNLAKIDTRAVIVPHAGYVYSGYTANIAYRLLEKNKIKNFLVIGPSHKIAFDGVSLSNFDSFDTPFGKIDNDIVLEKKLRDKFNISFISQAHMEHSTEVQFPFIKYYIEDVKIVELVYSNAKPALISNIIDYVLNDLEYGVIISTDLSHFYTLEEAKKLDNICLNAIETQDINLLHSGCEACGIIGIEAMILSAKKLNLKTTLLDYSTSADASNDTSRVVGYISCCFN